MVADAIEDRTAASAELDGRDWCATRAAPRASGASGATICARATMEAPAIRSLESVSVRRGSLENGVKTDAHLVSVVSRQIMEVQKIF